MSPKPDVSPHGKKLTDMPLEDQVKSLSEMLRNYQELFRQFPVASMDELTILRSEVLNLRHTLESLTPTLDASPDIIQKLKHSDDLVQANGLIYNAFVGDVREAFGKIKKEIETIDPTIKENVELIINKLMEPERYMTPSEKQRHVMKRQNLLVRIMDAMKEKKEKMEVDGLKFSSQSSMLPEE